jgi:magnesium transporter
MQNTFDKLGPAEVDRIGELRRADQYFWVDLTVEPSDREAVEHAAETLGFPEAALAVLADFDQPRSISRKFHTDADQVVFPFFCVGHPDAPIEGPARAMGPLEVHVLVHGDYLLTVHREPCPPLDELRAGELPQGRSEQYLVYLVLDAMNDSVFEALAGVDYAMEGLEEELSGTVGKTDRQRRRAVIGGAGARLTALRRRVAPQRALFEHVGEEVEAVRGLEPGSIAYLDRIDRQLDRMAESIDAASQSLSGLLDLGLNRTIYRLTVIATIFLPLTFVTGFFGMNFGWMVEHVDSVAAFLVFGIGSLVIATVLIGLVISRETALPGLDRRPARPRPGR